MTTKTRPRSVNASLQQPKQWKIACLGGIYSNHLALAAALKDLDQRGIQEIYCLGDLGAFGPFPDQTIEILREREIPCLQGNYDDSIGNALEDCQCGYTDPRDNHFAQLSYDYTLANTSQKNRAWLRSLNPEIRLDWAGYQVALVHGSPRRVNEFLWSSTTSTQFLDSLVETSNIDLLLATHTGIKWERKLSNGKNFVNVGVLGRPENDGSTHVWYTILQYDAVSGLQTTFVPVCYDYKKLAAEMKSEQLPQEFIRTIETGWWTTCLEILPSKERRVGAF